MSEQPVRLGDADVPVYVALPDGPPPWKAMLVLAEAFGLTDDIRRICDRFAAHGYLAAAPAYLGGGALRCVARAFRDLRRGSGPTVDRLQAALAWLGSRPDVLPGAVGVAGFCLGGGYALLLGAESGVRAAAANYGELPDPERLARLCPVVASYGEKDRLLRGRAARLAGALEDAGVAHDVKEYPEAGHSFMNDHADHPVLTRLGRPLLGTGYRPDEAADAWGRIFHFLAEHL